MKKFLFTIAACISFILIACSSKKGGGMSDAAKKNIEASQTVAKAFETGDVSKIDDVVAEDFVDHTDRGDMGRDSLKAAIVMMHALDSTMKFNTLKEFADDEYAVTWYKFSGTSDGTMGMPKGPYEMNSIELVKFKDGKAIEHWSFVEMREAMKMMMGAAQPMPAEENKDSKPLVN